MSVEPRLVVSEAYSRVVASDARFFKRRPNRRWRIRRAHRDETAELEFIPPDVKWYAVVKNIRGGVRVRQFVAAPPGMDTDIGDSTIEFLLATMQPLASVA